MFIFLKKLQLLIAFSSISISCFYIANYSKAQLKYNDDDNRKIHHKLYKFNKCAINTYIYLPEKPNPLKTIT